MIREGFYIGRKVGDEWFIDDTESNNSATNPLKTKGAFSVSTKGGSNEIIVTDIQMPFFSMVVFMVKWVIASIPAFIILFIIFSVVAAIFGGVVAGLNGPGY
ncbi:MAG: hypothetical protein J4A00_08975 [Gammaproteobacteria bacterium]|nr:hypothetical protein [Gammaproteobacteria bacterium]